MHRLYDLEQLDAPRKDLNKLLDAFWEQHQQQASIQQNTEQLPPTNQQRVSNSTRVNQGWKYEGFLTCWRARRFGDVHHLAMARAHVVKSQSKESLARYSRRLIQNLYIVCLETALDTNNPVRATGAIYALHALFQSQSLQPAEHVRVAQRTLQALVQNAMTFESTAPDSEYSTVLRIMIEDKCFLLCARDGVHWGLLNGLQEQLTVELRRSEFPCHVATNNDHNNNNSIHIDNVPTTIATTSVTTPIHLQNTATTLETSISTTTTPTTAVPSSAVQHHKSPVHKLLHDLTEELRPSSQPWRFNQTMHATTTQLATPKPRRFRFTIPRPSTIQPNTNTTHHPHGDGTLVHFDMQHTLFGRPGLLPSRKGGRSRGRGKRSRSESIDMVSLPALLGNVRNKKHSRNGYISDGYISGLQESDSNSESESDDDADDLELAALLEFDEEEGEDAEVGIGSISRNTEAVNNRGRINGVEGEENNIESGVMAGTARTSLPTLQRLVPWAMARSHIAQPRLTVTEQNVNSDSVVAPEPTTIGATTTTATTTRTTTTTAREPTTTAVTRTAVTSMEAAATTTTTTTAREAATTLREVTATVSTATSLISSTTTANVPSQHGVGIVTPQTTSTDIATPPISTPTSQFHPSNDVSTATALHASFRQEIVVAATKSPSTNTTPTSVSSSTATETAAKNNALDEWAHTIDSTISQSENIVNEWWTAVAAPSSGSPVERKNARTGETGDVSSMVLTSPENANGNGSFNGSFNGSIEVGGVVGGRKSSMGRNTGPAAAALVRSVDEACAEAETLLAAMRAF